jgi:hypothetical protein
MVFNVTFNNTSIFHLYSGRQFYWWKKLEYPVKTTDLPAATTDVQVRWKLDYSRFDTQI